MTITFTAADTLSNQLMRDQSTVQIIHFYPCDATRKRKHGTCYGNVAGWVGSWVSVTRRYCV